MILRSGEGPQGLIVHILVEINVSVKHSNEGKNFAKLYACGPWLLFFKKLVDTNLAMMSA